MTEMEMNSLTERSKRRFQLEERFKKRCAIPLIVRDGKPCFQARSNCFFLVSTLKFPDGTEAIFLEFADSLEDVNLNRFEDGDLYYMGEMNEEEMFQAMIKEIENE